MTTKLSTSLLLMTVLAAFLTSGCIGNKTPKKVNVNRADAGSGAPMAEFGGESSWNDPFASDEFASDSMSDDYAGMDSTGSDMEMADGQFPELLGGEELPEGRAIPELPEVLFGFDSSEISPQTIAQLESNAEYLEKNADYHVVLRGHTDDQGTDEYNIALGSRRAQNVRDYLIGKGIIADRLHTMSFGENMPKVIDGGEDARAQNRRVEFFIFMVEDADEVASAM